MAQSNQPVNCDFLRQIELFADLPENDLDSICEMTEEVTLPPGQELFAEGSRGDQAYIIKSGEVEIFKTDHNRTVLLSVRGPGSVIGETALLIETPRNASVRARQETVFLVIQKEQFNQLLARSPSASRVLLNTVLARWQSNVATLNQSQKMAQLGTLTAGVAHELNNPAAAVRRGAGQLDQVLADFSSATLHLARLELDSTRQKALDDLSLKARQAASQPALSLDPLARSDLEAELEAWLDDHQVEDGWELAPALVNLGYDTDGLAGIADRFTPAQIPVIVGWLNLAYSLHSLLYEINQGAGRISEIVKALKSYSYLDQAPVQDVNLHEGLDNTLLILRSKVSKIRIRREYDPHLPRILAYGSELNQVWTNLIDNAADALENTAGAEITLRTTHLGSWVRVDIDDNGSGIPLEIRSRIFDSFFTTKPPGKGTGLGLDISYNIVTNKHRGDIKFFSRPGSTSFRVLLPVNFEISHNPDQAVSCSEQKMEQIMRRILESARTIAVLDDPVQPVLTYLQSQGYQIIRTASDREPHSGETVFPDVHSFPTSPDLVLIFSQGEPSAVVVEQAIQVGARAIWLECSQQSADQAWLAGLDVISDRSILESHQALFATIR